MILMGKRRLQSVAHTVAIKNILENCQKHVEDSMFTIPICQFKDLHIPLVMILTGKWSAQKAIQYLKELRSNGFVVNADYAPFFYE